MIGKTPCHYQVTEKLGEGGMGVVYKARDMHLDRFVALKVFPAKSVADPERKRRFIQEAKAASALSHPNIVTVYDIDTAEGVDFIAMEFLAVGLLRKRSLREGSPRRPFSSAGCNLQTHSRPHTPPESCTGTLSPPT